MGSNYRWLDLNDCRGGRDGASDPLSLAPNEVVEMRNGDTFRCIFFRKRGGATAPAIGTAFTGIISSLIAHFPSNNTAAAELWGCDDATPPALGRMAAASTFSNPTTVDSPSTGAGAKVRGASFNGKLFLAYQSAQDRLHAYDPNLAAAAVRRVSLSTPGEPTLTNFFPSAGTQVQDVVYRVRFRIKNGTTVTAQSEPSSTDPTLTSVRGYDASFGATPTIVTMPTAPDSATHWVVEMAIAKTAPTVFYEQIEQAITTTTWNNTNSGVNAATYVPTGNLSELSGLYAKWPSVKYLLTAFNRLLGLGQWGGAGSAIVSTLIVGGGGGGGNGGGGGGAGAVVQQSNLSISVQAYSVTVGNGGAKGQGGLAGAVGQDSVFNGFTAKGGGGGAGNSANATTGGSGGGGAGAPARLAGAPSNAPLGHAGGSSNSAPGATTNGGAGGGGAAAAGADQTNVGGETTGSNGGDGITCSITATAVPYGGGGGGGGATATAALHVGGPGGSGGGGVGGTSTNSTPPTAGAANTGGGGGGGGFNQGVATYDGAAGGSGIVAIRYLTGALTATGGTITTSGFYTVHVFTSSGTFTVTAISAATLKQSRVFYSSASGESDPAHGDDERAPNALTQRNWIDLDENTGGDGTGFAGPVSGQVYVFKYQQVRTLVPTGAASPVFNPLTLSTTKGAIDQECICVGEDAAGRPCVFFMDSQVGPMIVGPVPPTEIGQGIRDLWDTVNLSATNKVGQVKDYPKLGQVWFWFATGASNDPNVCAKYTKATGAWAVDDTGGKLRLARCAVLFAKTLGATMSRDLVPYVGYASTANKLLRGDTTDLDDDGTTCQALVKSRPITPNNGKTFRITTPYILAKAQDGVTLTVTIDADFGRIVKTGTINLTPTAEELASGATRVIRRTQELDITDVTYAQVQIGDAAAIAKSWTVERIYVPWEPLGSNP